MSASSQRSADGYCPKPSPAQETSLTAEIPFLPAASGKEKLSLRESKLLGLPVGFPEDTRQSCRFLGSLQREPEQKTMPPAPSSSSTPRGAACPAAVAHLGRFPRPRFPAWLRGPAANCASCCNAHHRDTVTLPVVTVSPPAAGWQRVKGGRGEHGHGQVFPRENSPKITEATRRIFKSSFLRWVIFCLRRREFWWCC